MKKSSPSIIPLSYDYQKMSPSSASNRGTRSDATTTFYDNQYQSLFGDPVPPTPSEDYLGHLDGSLYGSFRRDSYASAIADDFNRTITLAAESSNGRRLSRLFSETPITSTSMGLSPRLAPDIQILPDSGSGGNSSSDARDSPNYALLRPDVINPHLVDNTYDQMQDVASSGMQDYVEQERAAKEVTRRISDFSEDFKSNVGSLRESPPEIPEPPSRYTRQISNESYSSTEWFKPMNTYSEFTKMPKLRPSSKNVLSIKHLEMPPEDSPVAAMIHDSNGSSSGDDQRKLDVVPARPPDPPPSRLKSLQRQSTSIDSVLPSILSPPPPPPPPAPLTLPPPEPAPPPPIVRKMSPIILTDAITTGAEHRVTAPRTHKKTSFTIIAEKSPQSSRATSPPKIPQSGRISPFRGHGFREPEKPLKLELSEMPEQTPIAKPRMLQQKSLSTTHLKLPSISGPASNSVLADDSPRPSVQFNMSGNRMPMPMTHQKGILQTGKDPSSSSQETPLSNQIDLLTQRNKIRSCEALPLITDPYRTAIPRLSAPTAPTRPIIPNPNPTRKQRGLLRVINSADSNSRIPVRSNWASMDDLSVQRKQILSPIRIKARRRSSSTSPERRSSTQTEPRSSIASDRRSSNLSSITTSDFSFRRGSMSPIKSSLAVRRKSTFQPTRISHSTPGSPSSRLRVTKTPRKVAKPTTLSPIIGTPNKDLPQTSTSESQPIGFSLSRRESLSKIPVRNSPNGGSRSNSRLSSRANSRVSSRSSSPLKDFGVGSRVPSSRSPSRQTLRSDSKLTSRGGSRPVSRAASSRAPSRSTSRASTHQASTAVSRANSRASTRPNSRLDQAKAIANSRSTSRLSSRSDSPIKSRQESPPRTNRRIKSSSHSPALKKPRRKSKSPVKMKTRTPVPKRRNSRSLIPARVPTTKTSPKTKAPIKTGPRRDSPKRTSVRKQPISAKKSTAPSSIPKGGTKISTTPGVKKPSGTADSRGTPVPAKKPTSKSYTPAPGATPTGLKSRQASNLQAPNSQKTKAAPKREPPSPSVRQAIIAAAKLKREASSASIRKAEAKGGQAAPSNEQASLAVEDSQGKEGANGASKPLKRQPSTLTLISVGSKLNLLRKRSESNLSKKLEETKKNAEGGDGGGDESAVADDGTDATTNGKLVALTKANVVSMTTAAITAHPVQITTVLTNQLPKTNSSGQLLAGQEDMAIPAAILEKSQKTLENIQKTVTEATDEIQKTINENLTDLKILESDIGKLSEELGAGSPQPFEKTDSLTTVIEKRSQVSAGEKVATAATTAAAAAGKAVSNIDDAFGEAIPPTHPIDATVRIINPKDIAHPTTTKGHGSSGVTEAAVHSGTTGGLAATEDSTERVSEHTISVLPEVDCESANLQSNETRLKGDEEETTTGHTGAEGQSKTTSTKQNSVGTNNAGDVSKEGVIPKEAGSQDPLDEEEDHTKGCSKCSKCCKSSSCFCIPCRRSRCSKCCRKKQPDPEAAALATVEVVDEKVSCWKKIKCCKRKPKPPKPTTEDPIGQRKMEAISEEAEPSSGNAPKSAKQSKCGLCLSKVFCCRSVNKVEAASGDMEEVKKCCFCIPCRKKKTETRTTSAQPAWAEPEQPQEITPESTAQTAASPAPTVVAPKANCCSRFFQKLNCCKKKPPISESRRASMKQANVPLPEDNRRKLHVDLIEYNSKMKGAIPVMPLYLAWFCAICNTLVPGLGTLLSGFFCICVGIPRFSQYDSAKARFGSFIINCIVAVAQLFCVLFCFVGWGWSIWWGTIMLKTAKKLNKIRKVEKLEMEEEKRQAEMAAAATLHTTDVEAGKT